MSETAIQPEPQNPDPGGAPPPDPASEASHSPESAVQPAIAPESQPAADPASEPAPTPSEPEITWPEDWRQRIAGKDEEALKQLNRFKSPENVFKSWRAAQQKISSGEYTKAKPDASDEAGLAEWREANGIPESPEGYLDNMPEGIALGEEDTEIVSDFVTAMHEADMPPGAVHSALQWYTSLQEKQAEQQYANDEASRIETEDILRADWGDDYTPNFNAIGSLVATFGNEEVLETLQTARTADGKPLGNHIPLMDFLASVGRYINPRATVVPKAGHSVLQTIDEEIAGLENQMKDRRSWFKNEDGQKRYMELLRSRDQYRERGQ